MDEWRKLLAWLRTTGLTVDEARAALFMALTMKRRQEREERRQQEFNARQMQLFQETEAG